MKKLLMGLFLLAAASMAQAQSYTIDVLVVYNQYILDTVRQPALDNFIAERFPASNEVFANNKLPIKLRLVGTYLTPNYVEKGGAEYVYDLAWLASNGDGYVDDVHAERKRVGADLVVMLTTKSRPCGAANALPKDAGNPAQFGFGIVRTDCYNGGFAMLHEIGHMMGLSHDAISQPLASYDNGHGFRSPDGSFQTQMSGGTIPYFSSATQTYEGKPLGNKEKADATAVLMITAPIVSKNMPTVIPETPTTPGC